MFDTNASFFDNTSLCSKYDEKLRKLKYQIIPNEAAYDLEISPNATSNEPYCPLQLIPTKLSDTVVDFEKKKRKSAKKQNKKQEKKQNKNKKQNEQDGDSILTGLQTVIDLCGLLDKYENSPKHKKKTRYETKLHNKIEKRSRYQDQDSELNFRCEIPINKDPKLRNQTQDEEHFCNENYMHKLTRQNENRNPHFAVALGNSKSDSSTSLSTLLHNTSYDNECVCFDSYDYLSSRSDHKSKWHGELPYYSRVYQTYRAKRSKKVHDKSHPKEAKKSKKDRKKHTSKSKKKSKSSLKKDDSLNVLKAMTCSEKECCIDGDTSIPCQRVKTSDKEVCVKSKCEKVLSAKCFPPLEIAPCDLSCGSCYAVGDVDPKSFANADPDCECKQPSPQKSVMFDSAGVQERKPAEFKKSRLGFPIPQPVIGYCNNCKCGGDGAQAIKYSMVKITEFSNYATYEIMQPSKDPPKQMPSCISEIFVLSRQSPPLGETTDTTDTGESSGYTTTDSEPQKELSCKDFPPSLLRFGVSDETLKSGKKKKKKKEKKEEKKKKKMEEEETKKEEKKKGKKEKKSKKEKKKK